MADKTVADVMTALKNELQKHQFVDVGAGVHQHLGVSREKLAAAIASMQDQGYEIFLVSITNVKEPRTVMKFLGRPGSTQRDAWNFRHEIPAT